MAMPRRGTPSGERPNRALTDPRGYADLVLVAVLAYVQQRTCFLSENQLVYVVQAPVLAGPRPVGGSGDPSQYQIRVERSRRPARRPARAGTPVGHRARSWSVSSNSPR